MLRIIKICLIGICFIGVFGCARTVTPVISFGTTAVVQVSLRGNADVANNKYYMVISSQESYEIPFSPYEFIEPGVAPADPSVNYYQYYSTWHSYVVLDDSGNYYRVPGTFVSTKETYAHEQIGTLGSPTTILQFNFNLEEVFPAGIPARMYFDFITVGETNIMQDHLSAPSKSTLTYTETRVSGSDGQDDGLDAGLDILTWEVLIQ